jgi:hypothetical protein
VTPHDLPGGDLAVSYAPVDGDYGVYLFDFDQKMPGRRVYDDPEWHDIDAMALAQKPEPQGRITIVVDAKSTGHLQCLNVYDSDRPEAAAIQKGDVKWVRLVEGIPATRSTKPESALTPFAPIQTRILGEAPVDPDGSFHVEVPADTPFFVQTLDDNGMALQTMRGWTWVRRGSRRGCIGCHENKELAPENRVTEALIRARPQSLIAPPEERRTVDFRQDVMPIVESRCTRCHAGSPREASLELTGDPTTRFNRAYENLLAAEPGRSPEEGGRYVTVGSARESNLIHLLWQWRKGADNQPVHPDASLTDAEKRTLIEWIDLGAQWDNRVTGENQTVDA